MLTLPIYLDNNATTRVDDRVLSAMLPYFTQIFGNPSSRNHEYGWQAEEAVDRAREQVACLIGAQAKDIVFTSGATESNNLAIKGLLAANPGPRRKIVTCQTEHKAVLDTCKRIEREGGQITYLPVDSLGHIDLAALEHALDDQTLLVSVMLANNETGTIAPLAEIGALCRQKGVFVHTDATQAVGKIPVFVDDLNVDLLSLSAHKLYGPKGIGALYVRRKGPRVRLAPLIDGGGHERGLRSGTPAVANLVGLGSACEIAGASLADEAPRIAALRDRLESAILGQVSDVYRNGDPVRRLPGTSNLSFLGVEGEALLIRMKDIAVSSGSACSSANPEPSYVLKALGRSDDLAHASLRFSFGRFNTQEEVDYASEHVRQAVHELRKMSPLYQA